MCLIRTFLPPRTKNIVFCRLIPSNTENFPQNAYSILYNIYRTQQHIFIQLSCIKHNQTIPTQRTHIHTVHIGDKLKCSWFLFLIFIDILWNIVYAFIRAKRFPELEIIIYTCYVLQYIIHTYFPYVHFQTTHTLCVFCVHFYTADPSIHA